MRTQKWSVHFKEQNKLYLVIQNYNFLINFGFLLFEAAPVPIFEPQILKQIYSKYIEFFLVYASKQQAILIDLVNE